MKYNYTGKRVTIFMITVRLEINARFLLMRRMQEAISRINKSRINIYINFTLCTQVLASWVHTVHANLTDSNV